eukprot:9502326-Pyramimonas_sp.AAC.1
MGWWGYAKHVELAEIGVSEKYTHPPLGTQKLKHLESVLRNLEFTSAPGPHRGPVNEPWGKPNDLPHREW